MKEADLSGVEIRRTVAFYDDALLSSVAADRFPAIASDRVV